MKIPGLSHSHEHDDPNGGHEHGQGHSQPEALTKRYKKILVVALIVNFAMCAVEITSGLMSASVALLADAMDFFGDGVNYGLSLVALGFAPVFRSKVALLKGIAMACFGVFVLGKAFFQGQSGGQPIAMTMGAIGFLALCANLFVAALLYRYRTGDANMRSVWLCTRNDAIGNLLVIAAAAGVWGTASKWPDLAVAIVMGLLALYSSKEVISQALNELRA
jgi:Co/Zn/Cd efflux system component